MYYMKFLKMPLGTISTVVGRYEAIFYVPITYSFSKLTPENIIIHAN